MDKMLTFKEKRYIEKRLKNSKEFNAVIWPSWGAWVVYALGGLLIAFVCFLTAINLSAQNISYILVPGIFAGMVLLIGGNWTQYKSRKKNDDKMLAGVLKKLLD